MTFERDQSYLDSLSDEYVADVIAVNTREINDPSNPKPWIHAERLAVFVPEAIKRGIAGAALTEVGVQ